MVSTPKDGLLIGEISQKELFRLAALVYSEFNYEVSTSEILFGIIKSVFVDEHNHEADIDTIIGNVLHHYNIIITEDEAIAIINQHFSSFDSTIKNGVDHYRLTDLEFKRTKEEISKNIDSYIAKYMGNNTCDDEVACRGAIYKYLYKLTTTNINSYQILFSKLSQGLNFYENDFFIDTDGLSEDEINYIRGFLEWDNQDKNSALFNIVSCCLEYCLLISGDTNNIANDYIQNRTIFLDTNIIFRALGINGKSREDITLAFLNKARQAKLKIVITSYTKKEFFETIDRYISQITSFNRGDIYAGAYNQLSDYNIFAFYYEWYETHKDLSLKYYREYIKSVFDKLVIDFNISTGFGGAINIYSKDALARRKKYEDEITDIKNRLHNLELDSFQRYEHDALLVYLAEETFRQSKENGNSSECLIISADKVLRFWDIKREGKTFPVIVYPSQLFLILVKVCGRSTNDLKSFISFINVKNRSKQISPEKANIVISGISTITSDIEAQKVLVGSVFNEDFQKILKSSNTDTELYEKTKIYSQHYLEDRFKDKEEKAIEAENEIQSAKDDRKVEKEKADALSLILQQEKEAAEKRKSNVEDFAKSHIKWRAILRFKAFPLFTFLLSFAFLVFVFFQIFFCKAEWNVVTNLIKLLKETTFGTDLDGIAYVVDFVIFSLLSLLYGYMFKRKILIKSEYEGYLDKKAQLYIKKNKLG